MIYYIQIRNRKPQRLNERHALDCYQMWHGNDRGQTMFDSGNRCSAPEMYDVQIWGENYNDSGWFKEILKGNVLEGFFDFDELIAT